MKDTKNAMGVRVRVIAAGKDDVHQDGIYRLYAVDVMFKGDTVKKKSTGDEYIVRELAENDTADENGDKIKMHQANVVPVGELTKDPLWMPVVRDSPSLPPLVPRSHLPGSSGGGTHGTFSLVTGPATHGYFLSPPPNTLYTPILRHTHGVCWLAAYYTILVLFEKYADWGLRGFTLRRVS